MDNIWTYIGVLLLAWVGWDLYAGYTVLHETIYRDEQPTLYWTGVAAWLGLAISCFFDWSSES